MTVKEKAPSKKLITKPKDKYTLAMKREEGKTEEKQFAEIVLSTTNRNTLTALRFAKGTIDGDVNLLDAVTVMRESTAKVNNGDLKSLESTLTVQATSLDAIFNHLALRAHAADTLPKLEVFMRLALKAQAQCARTIEVIATMKNPPVVFAKQANISNGNQQVNNGNLPINVATHAGKTINPSNELLEVTQHGSTKMDIRTATRAGDKDHKMATMEAVDRRKNTAR